MEVVVIVHAARTTTSEQNQLGVITSSKRKLITSETEIAHKQSTFPCSTTTVQDCPQLQWALMSAEHSDDDIHAASAKGRRRLKGIGDFFS